MNDRELLEYAAKAAGMNVSWDHYEPDLAAIAEGMFLNGERSPDNSKYWNPLTDDGDALRLAVKLAIDFKIRNGATWWDFLVSKGAVYWGYEPHNNDPLAATRRAITRAAAEIGRKL